VVSTQSTTRYYGKFFFFFFFFNIEIGLLATNTQNNFVRLKVATSGTSSNSA
jgi:hypothetical protein